MSDYAYVGFCKHSKARAICIDEPGYEKTTAEQVSEWIAGGLTIQRMEDSEARKAFQEKCGPCDAARKARQAKQPVLAGL